VNTDNSFGPGMLCPLPGSDNQVYDFADKKYYFKLSCHNQFRHSHRDRKQLGPVKDVDACGEACGADENCTAFLYYQPTFPGGRVDGARSCDLIFSDMKDGAWQPYYRPNQYLAGLRVKVRGES
jgi:hypothetical protein